jgi:hypothetical protein
MTYLYLSFCQPTLKVQRHDCAADPRMIRRPYLWEPRLLGILVQQSYFSFLLWNRLA